MPSENSLFSICMPTSQRVETLKESLPVIINEVRAHNIKIYVFDNNSTDGTDAYIRSLQEDYPLIFYKKSKVFREADWNIQSVLKMSNTKYKLLLGDHYVLLEGAAQKILHHLDSDEDYDALVLHFKGRSLFRHEDFIYEEPNTFLKELGWYIGLAATTIYHYKMVEGMDFEKYHDTNFTQSLAALDYLSKKKFKVKYIDEELVTYSKSGVKGGGSWHDQALRIFAKNWYKGIMSLPDVYSHEAKLETIKNHAKMAKGFFSFKTLLLYRFAGGFSTWNVIQYSYYFYQVSDFKTLIKGFIVSLIPIFLIPYLFKKQCLYIKRVLGHIDRYKDKFDKI